MFPGNFVIWGFMFLTATTLEPAAKGPYGTMNDCYEQLAREVEKSPGATGSCQTLPKRQRSDMDNEPDIGLRFNAEQLRALIK